MWYGKALVVYYSITGHTRKVAEEIAASFKADVEEIKDEVDRHGIRGWLRSGIEATLEKEVPIEKLRHNLADYDLVIIGTPMWNGRVSSPVRSFLKKYKDEIKETAFFLTAGGPYRAMRLFNQMMMASEKSPVGLLAVRESEILAGSYQARLSQFISDLSRAPVQSRLDFALDRRRVK